MDYIESHFKKVTSMQGMSDSDLVNMFSGNGGTQVDLVFYVFAQSRSCPYLESRI